MDEVKHHGDESNEVELQPKPIIKLEKVQEKETKIAKLQSQPSLGRSLSLSLSRKKSFRVKDDSVEKIVKNYYKSYAFATGSAIAFGLANYIVEDTSSRLGTKGLFAQSFGILLAAIIY